MKKEMNLEEMIKVIDNYQKQISENQEMFRFLKEETGAKVSIHIRAEIPVRMSEEGEVIQNQSRSCHIETINHSDDEDIEALKRIISRNIGYNKNAKSGVSGTIIKWLQEDEDQGSE